MFCSGLLWLSVGAPSRTMTFFILGKIPEGEAQRGGSRRQEGPGSGDGRAGAACAGREALGLHLGPEEMTVGR